jgi:hypothetical protein
VGGVVSEPDRIDAAKLERIRRLPLDAADRRVLAQVLAALVLLIVAAAALGTAVHAFLWTSGLGG